jgi:hypothetical protein
MKKIKRKKRTRKHVRIGATVDGKNWVVLQDFLISKSFLLDIDLTSMFYKRLQVQIVSLVEKK